MLDKVVKSVCVCVDLVLVRLDLDHFSLDFELDRFNVVVLLIDLLLHF